MFSFFFFFSAVPTILRTCARVVHLVFSSLLNRINKKKKLHCFSFFFSCVCVCACEHRTLYIRAPISQLPISNKKENNDNSERQNVCVFFFFPSFFFLSIQGIRQVAECKKKKRRKSARTVYKNKGKRETDVVRFLDETPSLRLFCLVLHFIKLNTYI